MNFLTLELVRIAVVEADRVKPRIFNEYEHLRTHHDMTEEDALAFLRAKYINDDAQYEAVRRTEWKLN